MQNYLNAQFNSSKSLFLTDSIKKYKMKLNSFFFYEIPINVLLNLKIAKTLFFFSSPGKKYKYIKN